MRKKVLFLVLTCLLSISCVAQNGVMILNQSTKIDTLIMKQRQIHANDSTIDGFRVQIFMELGNDALRHADSVRTRFTEKYPEIPIYLVFRQPYYRLRIGDFRTRLEAENMYQQVKKTYKNAFVTADRIEMPYIALCTGDMIFDTLLADSIKEKIFIEEEEFIIDTLLLDSLFLNDTIYDFNKGIYYDE